MAITKDLYYNNEQKLDKVLTLSDLTTHTNDPSAHADIFSKYILSTTQSLFSALHNLGENAIFSDESTEGFAKLGSFICSYNSRDVFTNQPSMYGQLINLPSYMDSSKNGDVFRVVQLWFDTELGDMYIRFGTNLNSIKDIKFNRILLHSDVFSKSGTQFPSGEEYNIGTIFYRTDMKALYVLILDSNGNKVWTEFFDTQYEANTAKSLTNPWLKLDNTTNDDSIDKLEKLDNLNTYTSAGVYTCETNTIASSLTNSPTTNPFRLITMQNTSGNGTQLIIDSVDNTFYTRSFVTVSNSIKFTGWSKLLKSTDLAKITVDSTGHLVL